MKPTQKHAYCIMAHHELEILRTLVSLIDDYRNDIFIHLDAKSQIKEEDIVTYSSKLFFIKRRNVYWGGFSLTQVELDLLKFSYEHGAYSYYHLLSGVDLPLKSQDYIHEFFHEHFGKIFIGIAGEKQNSWISRRMNYYYLFEKHLKNDGSFLYRLNSKIINLQIKLGLVRNYDDLKLKMGPNWFSLTSDSVEYVIARIKWIKKHFRFTLISDEIAIHTVIWNSPFKDYIFDLDDQYLSCMRKIDWKRGRPYVWREKDYDELINSPYLFARKFSSLDMNIVNQLREYVKHG